MTSTVPAKVMRDAIWQAANANTKTGSDLVECGYKECPGGAVNTPGPAHTYLGGRA